MYAYQDSSLVSDGSGLRQAVPARPVRRLVPLFVATVVVLPLWWLLLLAFVVAFLFFAPFLDVLAIIPGAERAVERVGNKVGMKMENKEPLYPGWVVTWPELRHEGDADFYRARVDRYLDRRTERASMPKGRRKSGAPMECEVPLRKYRGVGGAYVIEAATARGWEPELSSPADRIRLRWPAARA
ncbi:hypothetical protein ACSNOK_07135 [Streptomyces sp. URMC 126]|uniref:hypothetical protein n=1 Tax=Streptomyces sp. URMC 126 TaxID=3423401 RepID=UPI003F1C2BB4